MNQVMGDLSLSLSFYLSIKEFKTKNALTFWKCALKRILVMLGSNADRCWITFVGKENHFLKSTAFLKVRGKAEPENSMETRAPEPSHGASCLFLYHSIRTHTAPSAEQMLSIILKRGYMRNIVKERCQIMLSTMEDRERKELVRKVL